MRAQDWPGELVAENAAAYDPEGFQGKDIGIESQPAQPDQYPGEAARPRMAPAQPQQQVNPANQIAEGTQHPDAQPTGIRPWNTLHPQRGYDLNTVEGRGQQALDAMTTASHAGSDALGWLTEGAASSAAGFVPESYEFDPKGYVTFHFPDGRKSTWSVLDDVIGPAVQNAFYREYGGLPADPDDPGNVIIPITGNSPEDYATLGLAYPTDGTQPRPEEQGRNWLPESVDAFARGAANTLGLDDEIDAGMSTLLYGDNFGDALLRSRSIRDYDENQHPYMRGAGTLVGSMLLPTKAGAVGRPAAAAAFRNALGRELANGLAREAAIPIARREAVQAAQSAVRRQLTREGAGYGAAYGAGSADGGIGERGLSAAQNAVYGGIGGNLVSRAGSGTINLRDRVFPRTTGPSETAMFTNAAERQGVDYLAADRPKAYGSQLASAITNSSMGSIPLSEGAERSVGSLAAATDRVAGRMGRIASDTPNLGQAVQRGLNRTLPALETKTAKLYNAIPIPQDAPATLVNTRTTLADLTAGFKSNARLSKLWEDNPRMKGTLEALSGDNKLAWGDLKAFRTRVGEELNRPGLTATGTDYKNLKALYGALSDDMRATAAKQGPGALRAFERANSYAAAKQGRINNIYRELLGDDFDEHAEGTVRTLLNWAQDKAGDYARFAQSMRALPPEEANTVRATLFDTLGTASAGRQNRTGDVFSPSTFMTNWSKLSPRARAVLFGGENARDVSDIVLLADGMKASARFANSSKTGIAVGGASSAGTFMANPLMGTLYLASQFGAGKLLGSPGFAKWLARMGKKPNRGAVRAHIKRLSGVAAAREAGPMSNAIFDFQQMLEDALKVDADPKQKDDNAEDR